MSEAPEKRKIERLVVAPIEGINRTLWVQCDMSEIRCGDVFRLWDVGGAPGDWVPVTSDPFGPVSVALADAEPVADAPDDRHGVACGRVNGFGAMDWALK